MYLPGRWDKHYNSAWSQVMSDTLYGNLTFYGTEKWYQKAEKTRIEIALDTSQSAKYSEWMIFLQGNFYVAEIDKAEDKFTWVYEAGEQRAPDYNPEMLEWLLKKSVSKKNMIYTAGVGGYQMIFDGCGKYSNISVQSTELGDSKYSNISVQSTELADFKYVRRGDGLSHIKWRIPAWDYADRIVSFLEEHNDESIEEVADRIMETENFNRTVQYIERIQEKYGKNVKLEEIREEYREFLIELLSYSYPERPLE
jgi:hypothetical protein